MSNLDLNVVDTDGAVREAELAVATDTRAAFFRKAAVTGGALGSAAFFTGMLPAVAEANRPSKRQDISIIKYALTLEYLEAEFYDEAIRDGGLSGATLDAARLIAGHEATHVTALRQTLRNLGAKVPKKPSFDFKGTNKGDKFVPTALVLENTGVRAYIGQARRLKSGPLLGAAASIATVEARHAAAIAILVNNNAFSDGTKNSITPYGAFDRASSMKKILGEVGATGFIQS